MVEVPTYILGWTVVVDIIGPGESAVPAAFASDALADRTSASPNVVFSPTRTSTIASTAHHHRTKDLIGVAISISIVVLSLLAYLFLSQS